MNLTELFTDGNRSYFSPIESIIAHIKEKGELGDFEKKTLEALEGFMSDINEITGVIK